MLGAFWLCEATSHSDSALASKKRQAQTAKPSTSGHCLQGPMLKLQVWAYSNFLSVSVRNHVTLFAGCSDKEPCQFKHTHMEPYAGRYANGSR